GFETRGGLQELDRGRGTQHLPGTLGHLRAAEVLVHRDVRPREEMGVDVRTRLASQPRTGRDAWPRSHVAVLASDPGHVVGAVAPLIVGTLHGQPVERVRDVVTGDRKSTRL